MKLDELKNLVANYSKAESDYVILQLYKLVPKGKRDEYDIDDLLQKPKAHIAGTQKPVKKDTSVSLEDLDAETTQFLKDAYAQNYLVPNRSVSKKDRPKWRFVVMRLYKEILNKSSDEQSAAKCTDLLENLYKMLTYSCGYTLFTAYDSFESIKIDQSDFFKSVIALYAKCYDKPQYIDKSIDLITDHDLNRYTLYSQLIWIFVDTLNIPDLKYAAIDSALTNWTATEAILRAEEKNKQETFGRSKTYKLKEKANNLVEIAFACYCSLFEFENAIEMYHEKYIERDPEVALYILVNLLFPFQKHELIGEQITLAEKRGIVPRQRLIEVKEHIRTHHKVPQYL